MFEFILRKSALDNNALQELTKAGPRDEGLAAQLGC